MDARLNLILFGSSILGICRTQGLEMHVNFV